VYMGMGEPLDNYEPSVLSANRLMDSEAFALSARHVTISTAGIVPMIDRLSSDTRATLAVSLHSARDDIRSSIMPVARRYPLSELKRSLMKYQRETGRIITMEYILIKNLNSSVTDAKCLVRFLHGLRAKVNLIPYNPNHILPYEKPDDETVRSFQKYLSDRSIPAPVRYSKGLDISAACGQLAAGRS
ncbi:MAG: 23S rRNA (adenine(2503)-C2)-methyltransferase, partial [Oligoflexales bacterium]|nr:23S rRNA (adenine(2503)-C2)-methyltransferase [Oligoflexales bacterium]